MATNQLVLLTGATGYIGGRVLKALEARGARVRCLARQPEFLRARVAGNTEVVAGDVLASDLTHPGLGGEELSKRLADAHPKLPMLVISAFQQGLESLRERHQSDLQAPRGLLAEPFRVEAVKAEVGRLIAAPAAGLVGDVSAESTSPDRPRG